MMANESERNIQTPNWRERKETHPRIHTHTHTECVCESVRVRERKMRLFVLQERRVKRST
jgi:hypothetical protein